MKELDKTIKITGGCGRVICALPAVEEYCKQNPDIKVNLVAAWVEPVLNNSVVYRKYHEGHAYLWQDVIKNTELINPEPYEDYEYYNQKIHIIQSFYKNLGLAVPKDIPRPKLHVSRNEVEGINNYFKIIRQKLGGTKPIIVFQPFGQGARFEKGEIVDESNRALKITTVNKILEALEKNYHVLLMTTLDIPILHKYKIEYPKFPLRNWIGIISRCDYVIGADSVGQHLAYAFEKPGSFFFGGTYPSNLAYDEHLQFVKGGFPKEYNPMRLPSNELNTMPIFNEGAMDFTEEEDANAVSLILNDLDKKFNKKEEVMSLDKLKKEK